MYYGTYKEFQLQQYSFANNAITQLANFYVINPVVKYNADLWLNCDNKITPNMECVVKLKVVNP